MGGRSYSHSHNVNCGTLKDLEEVHIDSFTKASVKWETNRAFFLTHAHMDHMDGLRDYFFEELLNRNSNPIKYRLYMHSITFHHIIFHFRRIGVDNLVEIMKVLQDRKVIVLLKKNKRYDLRFSREDVKSCWVTPLSAGHCPGSIMLQLEIEKEIYYSSYDGLYDYYKPTKLQILYTGDCRVNLKDLVYNPTLKMSNYTVDILYVDTTFIFSEVDFPTRKSVFDNLREYIDNNSRQKQQYMICTAGHLVHMYVAQRLFFKGKQPICVSKDVYEFCQQVEPLRDITEYDEQCSLQNKCLKQFHIQKAPHHWDQLSTSELQENQFQIVLQGNLLPFFKMDSDGMMKNKVGSKIFPGPYSTHLSPKEIMLIICLFKPEQVIPLVIPKGKTLYQVQEKLNKMATTAKTWRNISNLDLQTMAPDFPSFVHDFTGNNVPEPLDNTENVDIFYHS